jgi:predicted flap endonuclease-1-like 5' DNA nuclease
MRRTTKVSGYLVGIGAGAAAVIWLIKDRLLGPETTPVTPQSAPAFRVSPGPPQALQATDDDLSLVKGIGPVYRARLEEAGIRTFAGLTAAAAAAVAEAAQVAEEKAVDWITQASRLSAN